MRALNVPAAGQQPEVSELPVPAPAEGTVLIDLVSYTADGLPLDVLRNGGKVSSTLGIIDETALAAAGLSGANANGRPVREVIAPLAAQAAAGRLKADINTVIPLEQATEGLTTLASRTTRGKIVIKITG